MKTFDQQKQENEFDYWLEKPKTQSEIHNFSESLLIELKPINPMTNSNLLSAFSITKNNMKTTEIRLPVNPTIKDYQDLFNDEPELENEYYADL